MISYTYQNGISNTYLAHLKSQFNLNNPISNEAKFIRLLLGTLKITNIHFTDSIEQFTNYSVLGRRVNSPVSTRPIKECLEPICTLQSLCNYLDSTSLLNNNFFLHLLEEVSSYFYKTSKGSNTTSFVHLYRMLEYISYSFPLIYASISREYYGSFNRLKNYFDTSKSELLFFDEFTKSLLDNSYLESQVTFNFNTLSPEINKNHYNIIKGILKSEEILDAVDNVSLTTSYQYLLKLVVDIRNRYFHFAMGGKRNIRSTEIIENDIFFTLLNEELLNFLSIIYFKILTVSVSRSI